MTTIEVTKLLWQAIEESEPMTLTPEEQQLFDAVHGRLMDYEDEVRRGDPSAERHCIVCMVPVNRCCCQAGERGITL